MPTHRVVWIILFLIDPSLTLESFRVVKGKLKITQYFFKFVLEQAFNLNKKIKYIHMNPVEERFVFRPKDYPFSIAVGYSGEKGLLDGIVVVR